MVLEAVDTEGAVKSVDAIQITHRLLIDVIHHRLVTSGYIIFINTKPCYLSPVYFSFKLFALPQCNSLKSLPRHYLFGKNIMAFIKVLARTAIKSKIDHACKIAFLKCSHKLTWLKFQK